MKVSIDLTIVPLGVGNSLSQYIAACKVEIEKRGLDYELGPNGTAIEGEWDEVFECVKACHEALHSIGIIRIFSTLKVNTRIDREVSFRAKVDSVNACISDQNT